eukprot:1160979-Pelagomonas_calceolata.AAC.4
MAATTDWHQPLRMAGTNHCEWHQPLRMAEPQNGTNHKMPLGTHQRRTEPLHAENTAHRSQRQEACFSHRAHGEPQILHPLWGGCMEA